MPLHATPKNFRRVGVVEQIGVELCIDGFFSVAPRCAILKSTGKQNRWFLFVPKGEHDLRPSLQADSNPYRKL